MHSACHAPVQPSAGIGQPSPNVKILTEAKQGLFCPVMKICSLAHRQLVPLSESCCDQKAVFIYQTKICLHVTSPSVYPKQFQPLAHVSLSDTRGQLSGLLIPNQWSLL